MGELLDRSAHYIDQGVHEGAGSMNPMDGGFAEVADGIGMVQAFSHVVALDAGEDLVLFDVSLETFGEMAVQSLRSWSTARVDSVVYTHGHIDHVGGMPAFLADAQDRGYRPPTVVGHENVEPRFERYGVTRGYNDAVNHRQFGGTMLGGGGVVEGPWAQEWVRPGVTYGDQMDFEIGDLRIQLHHDLGETDDHTWAWIPEHRALCTGDFMCWVFPNAGNPQKVQRYPWSWATALRRMATFEAELLLPAHGLPIAGKERIAGVLDSVATALEGIVGDTLAMMNEGEPLDSIIHQVSVPTDRLELPYLRPVYDEPEFVVHNVWRYYGGWYDGNPARLKPAPADHLAVQLAELSGGATVLARRGRELADQGDLRTACHLVQLAGDAAPEDPEVHELRAEVYRLRRKSETSLMAAGIYRSAEQASRSVVGDRA